MFRSNTEIEQRRGRCREDMRRRFWILLHIFWCPVCGREKEYRERIYDKPKPRDPAERCRIIDDYDYCDVW